MVFSPLQRSFWGRAVRNVTPTAGIVTESLLACPICASTAARPVLRAADGFLGELSLVNCCQCGIIYLNPRLAPESTTRIEDNSTVYDYGPVATEQMIDVSFAALMRWLTPSVPSAQRRMLDVGCNRGLLLEAARRQGWQVTGVELSPVAAQHAREVYGLTVYPSLETLPAGAKFDLITLWHVLEHAHAPVEFLRTVASFLANSGLLAIQVPDFEAVERYRERGAVSGILCAVHNFYFTENTLLDVARQASLYPMYFDQDRVNLWLTLLLTNSRLSALRRRIAARFGR